MCSEQNNVEVYQKSRKSDIRYRQSNVVAYFFGPPCVLCVRILIVIKGKHKAGTGNGVD